jgi:hypothetical protein
VSAPAATDPLRLLALAVLAQAVRDARQARRWQRKHALLFLRPQCPSLAWWCDVADLDATALLGRLAERLRIAA